MKEINMKNKVLISVAPVSAADKKIDPKKIADEVNACYEAGAAMVHLHVRDYNGNLTSDMSVFKETAQLIREKCDIVIEASTGGVSELSIEERCMPLYYDKVEMCSLNVGSTNLGDSVYKNPIPDVRFCVEEIVKQKKHPEIEVFELGHIYMMEELQKEFNVPKPLLYSIVLGHPGEAPANTEALMSMVNFIPKDAYWGITHAYRKDFGIIAGALGLGAKTVRIGFEDSNYLDNENLAKSNLPLVIKTVKLLKAMDKEPMSSEEARHEFYL